MAKVSLRVYNREIEGMIESGKLDEAVAHCQHILKSYPMYVETYRLLGKSFLEARRYADAADIFQRALMAVPDDFVAHVGMSIIRDDEGKLDDAIWHMERAFESQPSNPAIQGELRRLYGRRDGVEPPKIRLSRDALANMYAQGELFNQAIAEIRTVLAEDSNRPDLQVMLARAYFRSGQKIEAAEMAANLLKKYNYCMDALRILVEVLPGSARAENTQVYRQRLRLLDPYSSFVTGSVFNTDQVSDTAVTLDRLDYLPGTAPAAPQPNWASSLGIKLTDEKRSEPTPDWLKATDTSETYASQAPVSPANTGQSTDDKSVPDWMRSGGWQESSGKEHEASADSSLEPPAEQIAKADIPDWLKAMAPQEVAETAKGSEPTSIKPPSSGAGDIPDWLTGMDEAGKPPANISAETTPPTPPVTNAGDIPDWLTGMEEAGTSPVNLGSEQTPPPAPVTSSNDLPDWLAGMGADVAGASESSNPTQTNLPTEGKGEIPDWLAGPGDVAKEVNAEPESPSPTLPPFGEGKIPDWLSENGANPPETVNEPLQPASLPEDKAAFPDWLKEMGDTGSAGTNMAIPEAGLKQPKAEQLQESPEVVPSAPVDQVPGEPVVSPALTGEDVPFQPSGESKPLNIEDDTMAWLEGLAAKQGAKEEELLTKPVDRGEEIPDWLQPVGDQPVSTTVPETPPVPTETRQLDSLNLPAMELRPQEPAPSEELQAPVPSSEEVARPLNIEDDTMAWLEGLAAKQGAKEEELLSKPEDRLEEIPDWLRSVDEQPSASIASEPPAASTETLPLDEFPPKAEELPSQDQASTGNLSPNTENGSEDIPDWLRSINEPPAVPSSAEPSLASGENLHLEEMSPHAGEFESQEKTPSDELVSLPEKGFEDVPDWSRPADEKPLATPIDGTPEPIEDESSDWLDDLEFEQVAKPEDSFVKSPEVSETPPEEIQETKSEDSTPEKTPVSETPQEDMSITSWLSKLDVEEALGKSQAVPEAEQTETVSSADLPDWLKEMEESAVNEEAPKPAEDLPGWLRQPAQSAEDGANGIQTPEPAPEPELPTWVDEETPVSEKTEATAPGEWVPVDEKPAPIPTVEPKAEPVAGVIETPLSAPSTESPEVVAVPPVPPIVPKGTGMLARLPARDKDADFLAAAQSALDANKLDEAMRGYATLIKKNRLLDEVIHDLREAIYRFPVDIIVWQTLGDASMRANRLQDALDAYTKAEELLR